MENGRHILLGVAGSPVLHSKSPAIFRSIFRHHGIDGSYIKVAVESASDAARLLKELAFTGMNITAPFKNNIVSHVKSMSGDAEKIGTVNTVVNNRGNFTAYNTDHLGVTSPLEQRLGGLKNRKAVVAGAGGAGVAAVYGLVRAGCHVTVLNITATEAENAARRFGCSHDILSNADKYFPEADIVVSTLPYEADPMNISLLKKGSVFMDALYKKSHYASPAAQSGIVFITGEDWLLHQALYACGHFLGFIPSVDVAANGLKETREVRNNIALIGFMGSGKSTVGRELARIRKMEFIDIDELIEKKISKSINQIFNTMGEKKFRDMESDLLHSFSHKKGLVISCGGGIVLNESNRSFLREKTECIWLYCGMDLTRERVTDGARPLINAMKNFSEITELFNARKKLYASSCDSIVLSENSPQKTAEHIDEEIRLSL
jgi:shikimate dehydrogenase